MKRLVSLILAALMVLSLSALAEDEGGEKYAFIAALNQLEFFDANKAGMYAACEEIGATWYVDGGETMDIERLCNSIDQAVALGVSGIVIASQSPSEAESVNKAIEAGVPVILINTDLDCNRIAFIGCGAYNAGHEMAKTCVECLDGKTGTILITGSFETAQPSTLENQRGAEEYLDEAGYPHMTVDDGADASTAATKVGAMLQANPDIVGIIGLNAYDGVGAATAVRESGYLPGEITIISRDRDSATLDLIESGEIQASFAQNSFVEAYMAVMWLHEYINGSLRVVDDYLEAGINPLPNSVDSGSIVITKENAELFRASYTYEVTAKN